MNKPLSIIALSALILVPAMNARVSAQNNGEQQVLSSISSETGVPVATLQSERAQTGLGYGELRTANLLANSTGKSFDQIVALRNSGMGWGQIAKQNNLKLGHVVSGATRSNKASLHANAKANGNASFAAMGKAHGSAKANANAGISSRLGNSGNGNGGGHGGGHGK